ncbi:MAG: M28 family peptidase [Pyrinomonadaceae bacterium]
MKRITAFFLIIAFASTSIFAQDLTASFDADKMRQRVIRLSADDFEGRGPGNAGGRRAAQYIADQMKASGVRPANRGSYLQNVKLVGVKADPKTTLQIGNESFRFGDDFVATTSAQKAKTSVGADLVFVGYGIDAPNYKWNDYKGPAADYRGKVLMMMVNDPPATDAEPDLFGAKALTYYGRWTYKYEEAARRGAVGVILIHTTESASYGWNVVRASNGSWRYEIARTRADRTPFLTMKSWVTNEAANRILKSARLDIDDLRKKAQSRDFTPVKTGLRVRLDLNSEMMNFNSPNVVGMVEGSDPRLKREFIVYTAHWDHLGIGEPDASGDRIYNGAFDNASGVAAVLGIADVLTKMPARQRPKRSALFLFTTAEEQGLLGAEYYSLNPLVSLSRTAANINIDSANFVGKVSSFSPLGAERSTLWPLVEQAALARGYKLLPDLRPEQGIFYRSDHFPLAKVGIPAIHLKFGEDFDSATSQEARAFFKDYNAKFYHQPSDEVKDWWSYEAMVQEAEFALGIGILTANAPAMPRYKNTDEFSSADKRRFAR